MSIRCKNGPEHTHESAAEVRACYGVAVATPAAMPERPSNLIPQGPRPAGPNAKRNAQRIEAQERQTALFRAGQPHFFTPHCPQCVAGTCVNDPTQVRYNQTANDRLSDEPPKDEPSDKQLKFIGDLLRQHHLIARTGLIADLTKRVASELITDLLHWNPDKPMWSGLSYDPAYHSADGDPSGYGDPKPARDTSPLPSVPQGHYAIKSLTGNNDLDFFRVDRKGSDGNSGKTFIKRVIGGHPDQNIRFTNYRAVLEAILAAGVDEAGTLYGVTIGRCRRCNRHLTDEESRAAGIGPDCAQM